jgi:hypothetical protein
MFYSVKQAGAGRISKETTSSGDDVNDGGRNEISPGANDCRERRTDQERSIHSQKVSFANFLFHSQTN